MEFPLKSQVISVTRFFRHASIMYTPIKKKWLITQLLPIYHQLLRQSPIVLLILIIPVAPVHQAPPAVGVQIETFKRSAHDQALVDVSFIASSCWNLIKGRGVYYFSHTNTQTIHLIKRRVGKNHDLFDKNGATLW